MPARRSEARAVTLTTDFGETDPYVAEMKGVLIGLNASVRLVDVSHGVEPQRVLHAAYITQVVWPCFPAGSIHVAVVDPGVGTERRAIVLETPTGVFVGPDNGVLSAAAPDEARPAALSTVALPNGCRAFEIANPRYMRQPVSATFHGRDIFAPAAAHISLGVKPAALGDRLEEIMLLPPLRAQAHADGAFHAQVLHVDRFGNVVTDIRADDLPEGGVVMEVGETLVRGPVRTYGDLEGLGLLAGGSGFLELARQAGDAAGALGLAIGDRVWLRPEG